MMYMMPIYAALALGVVGLLSRAWRLHASMAILSVLTLWAVVWLQTYALPQWDDLLAASLFDGLFGGAVGLVMMYLEPVERDCPRKKSRLYKYYAIILSVFLFTSMLNVIAWVMQFYGVYEDSLLRSTFRYIVLAANIIQVSCLIEGGIDGLKNIIIYFYNTIMGPHFHNIHKDSVRKITKE